MRAWRQWPGVVLAATLAALLSAMVYMDGSNATGPEAWAILMFVWMVCLGVYLHFVVLPPEPGSLGDADMHVHVAAESDVLGALTKEPEAHQVARHPLLKAFLVLATPFVAPAAINMVAHPGQIFGGDYWRIFLYTACLSAVVFSGLAIYVRRPMVERVKHSAEAALYLVIIGLTISLTAQHLLGWKMERGLQNAIIFTALLLIPSLTSATDLSASQASWKIATIEARTRALGLEKANLDARLRSLQAQIEPHFLFNTLANISALIDSSPTKARQAVDRLSDYLRTSLDRMREGATTLGQELDSVRAYLEISSARMGPRLRWEIDVGDTPATFPLAPLLVQPLVENAVRHGLEPEIEGGTVKVEVRRREQTLVIEVIDTGCGITETSGAGLGLANVRERMRALYGPDARLTLEQNDPKGLRARLEIPLA
ncbi:MAG: histidine kinase [Planctomycetota bacterium]